MPIHCLNSATVSFISKSDQRSVNRSGYLHYETSRQHWQKTWCTLNGNVMYISKKRDKPAFVVLILENASVEITDVAHHKSFHDDEVFPFAVIMKTKNGFDHHVFVSHSSDDQEFWIRDISRASFEYTNLVVADLQKQVQESGKPLPPSVREQPPPRPPPSKPKRKTPTDAKDNHRTPTASSSGFTSYLAVDRAMLAEEFDSSNPPPPPPPPPGANSRKRDVLNLPVPPPAQNLVNNQHQQLLLRPGLTDGVRRNPFNSPRPPTHTGAAPPLTAGQTTTTDEHSSSVWWQAVTAPGLSCGRRLREFIRFHSELAADACLKIEGNSRGHRIDLSRLVIDEEELL